MRINKNICAVCKDRIKGEIYTISRSHICSSCNDKDYIKSSEVAKLIGVPRTCIAKHVLHERYNVVPPPDALRATTNLLWKRATILEFKKTIPNIDTDKVRAMLKRRISTKDIAKEMGVDVFYVNRVGRADRLKGDKKPNNHKNNVDGEPGKKQYNLANKLLNSLLIS